MTAFDAVILDLDGTLVDSVYQHVVAWQGAFHEVGLNTSAARIHGAIGMGGDKLVAQVAGESAEKAVGDAVRDAHQARFLRSIRQVRELAGATELIELLAVSHQVVLATSSNEEVTEALLSVVAGRAALHAVISGSAAERSKPDPDILRVAMAAVSSQRALVVGDSVWDARAAGAAGLPSVALRTGGFADERLMEAGAQAVYDDPAALVRHLERSPLRGTVSGFGAP